MLRLYGINGRYYMEERNWFGNTTTMTTGYCKLQI